MEVIKNQVDELNIELTLKVAAEDYAAARQKKLSERRRTAEFKGFRKGNVPMSLIEKFYGEQALFEAVNDVISEQLNSFVTENKLSLIGEPMASEKQSEIEWANGNDFTFIFDMATAPKVDVKVEAADAVTKYVINITQKAIEDIKADMVKYDESKKDLPEDQLKEEARKILENQYASQSEYRLAKDIRDFYVNKSGIVLPEAFLKRWLISINKDKHSEEEIEKDFPAFIEDYKWQSVRESLFASFGHKLEEEDLREAAKSYVSYQYAMYGMAEVPEDLLNEAVVNILQNEDQVRRLVDQVEEKKVMDSIKGIITIKDKKTAFDTFKNLK